MYNLDGGKLAFVRTIGGHCERRVVVVAALALIESTTRSGGAREIDGLPGRVGLYRFGTA
jgi:hypothetical protein